MKNLLILMLVLGLASVSQAQTVGLTVGGLSEYEALVGAQTITIALIADLGCSGAFLGAVVEGDSAISTNTINMGGSIANPAAGTGAVVGDVAWEDNYNGALLSVFSVTASPAIAAGDVILSFDYTFTWNGTDPIDYWVAPLADGATYVYDGGSMPAALSYANLEVGGTPTDIGITGVHIIPEPMTIALLGLGGLALLRRRK